MEDLTDLVPTTDDDYAAVHDSLVINQTEWEDRLDSGLTGLVAHLDVSGYLPLLAPKNPELMAGAGALAPSSVVLSARVKTPEAIIAKMRRFGEPLRVMLDRWGYRVIVADEPALAPVADICAGLWETPSPVELLLRNGELQFEPRRDYRRRDHAGLSAATTNNYDEAVHLNRRASFGITEIQVMTYDLYRRVHCDPTSADSHDAFVARREQLLRDRAQ